MLIHLSAVEIDLPERTLHANWYDGKNPITALEFYRMEIVAIEPNAFESQVFNDMETLLIENLLHITEYRWEMFIGLENLYFLTIKEKKSERHSHQTNLLRLFSENLEHFSYFGDLGTGSVLTHLFGGSTMFRLTDIIMRCRAGRFRVIAADNFTGLRAIEDIDLHACGIETIELGTFDRIARTLLALTLRENPLTKLSSNSFQPFLDKWPATARDAAKDLKFFESGDLGIKCSLEFYRLRNATIISFTYDENRMEELMCENDVHVLDRKALRETQFVHPLRWHLNHSDVDHYAVRKFRLRFNATDRRLRVIQADPLGYRLFIWSVNRNALIGQKCPLPTWIADNVDCQLRNRWLEVAEIPEFNGTDNLIAVCVIHDSLRKQSVPLHCNTIRTMDLLGGTVKGFTFNWLYYGIGMALGILAGWITIMVISDGK